MSGSDFESITSANHTLEGVWESLRIAVRELLLCELDRGKAEIYTYRAVSGHAYHKSPWVTFDRSPEGIFVQISGNVVCEPPLSTADMAALVLLGWTLPQVTPEEFLDENGFGGFANVSRTFPITKSFDTIAHDVVIALRNVYHLAEGDYLVLSRSAEFAEHFASLGLLERFEVFEKNEQRRLFKLLPFAAEGASSDDRRVA